MPATIYDFQTEKDRIEQEEENDVKRMYAGIVYQAIRDIENPPYIETWEEVELFLTSDWGKRVCNIVGIPADKIETKYDLTEKIKKTIKLRKMINRFGKSEYQNNDEIAQKLDLPISLVERFIKSSKREKNRRKQLI